VPIQRTSEPTSSPSSVNRAVENADGITILMLLTMPSVTDWDMASGLPIANTASPTCNKLESPNSDGGEFARVSGLSFKTEYRPTGRYRQFGGDFLVAGEDDDDAGGVAGDVMVRDDKAVLGDDDAAAAGFVFDLAALKYCVATT